MHWEDQYFTAMWISPCCKLVVSSQSFWAGGAACTCRQIFLLQPSSVVLSVRGSDSDILPSLLLDHTFRGSQAELGNLLFIHRTRVAQHFCEWSASFPLPIFILSADCWQIGSKTQQDLGEYLLIFNTPIRCHVLAMSFYPIQIGTLSNDVIIIHRSKNEDSWNAAFILYLFICRMPVFFLPF